MRTYPIKDFKYGVIDNIESFSIPDGAFEDNKNWQSRGDSVELALGGTYIGDDDTGSNPSYIHTAYKADGTEILFKKTGAKLYYYKTSNDTWTEIGTNLFTAAGVNDVPSFANYSSAAGFMVFITSQHMGVKIMTANPDSYVTFGSGFSDGYYGNMAIFDSAMWLWNRPSDPTTIYRSHKGQEAANYTTVVKEQIGTGDGVTKTFTDTLDFKAFSNKTCFAVEAWLSIYKGDSTSQFDITNPSGTTFRYTYDGTGTDPVIPGTGVNNIVPGGTMIITAQNFAAGNKGTFVITNAGDNWFEVTNSAGVVESDKTLGTGHLEYSQSDKTVMEYFSDDMNGNLTSEEGGTGTINYTTGAISITFKTAPLAGNVWATYKWELTSTNGLTDFSYTSPTRLVGEGMEINQPDNADPIKNVVYYQDSLYAFHEKAIWKTTIYFLDDGVDSVERVSYNAPWRQNIGIDSMTSSLVTGDGVYYIDLLNGNKPTFRILTLDIAVEGVVPKTVTDNINLEDYFFDKCCMFQFQNYILFSARTLTSAYNDTVFVFDTIWKTIDKLDWSMESAAVYGGKLAIGYSKNGSVAQMFNGFETPDGLNISNYIIGNYSEIGAERLKKSKKLVVEGFIAYRQNLIISVRTDHGDWIRVGTVEGDSALVDRDDVLHVLGYYMIGEKELGEEETTDTTEAYHFKMQFKCNTLKFNKIQYKIQASGVGPAKLSMIEYWDVRAKNYKLPAKYRR